MSRQTGFSAATKELIRDRACWRCERCGERTSDCVAHHRRPRGMGGTRRVESNLPSAGLWLCGMCHLHVETYRTLARDEGFLVRQGHDPATAPVAYRKYSDEDETRVLVLLDDGTVMPSDWAA